MNKEIILPRKVKRYLMTPLFSLLFSLAALLAAVFLFLREPMRQALAPAVSVSPGQPAAGFEASRTPKVKYIFLMIGDGMGEAQRGLAQCYAEYCGEKTPLIINSLPANGVVTTNSLNNDITDSAAAATALATGHKTNNGMISITPEGEVLKTIIEEAEDKGLSTGLVTTSKITDATPAAFAAHTESRTREADIALDYLGSGVDFFAGGGVSYFLPISFSAGGIDAAGAPLESLRGDEKDIVSAFEDAGYETFIGMQGAKDFNDFVPWAGCRVFAAFTNDYMPYESDRKEEGLVSPTLAEMTDKAISALEYDEDGFVLIIEGGRIDHACNFNDAAGAAGEALAFNEAAEEAYAFYGDHPGETLMIVVGDHETGGLMIGEKTDFSHISDVRLSVQDRLQFVYDGGRDEFFQYIAQNFGLGDLNPGEKWKIKIALDSADNSGADKGYGSVVALTIADIISKRAGVSWKGIGHTNTPVILYAAGPRSKDFSGNIDNTKVGLLLFEIIGY